jgi:hypothetical protein
MKAHSNSEEKTISDEDCNWSLAYMDKYSNIPVIDEDLLAIFVAIIQETGNCKLETVDCPFKVSLEEGIVPVLGSSPPMISLGNRKLPANALLLAYCTSPSPYILWWQVRCAIRTLLLFEAPSEWMVEWVKRSWDEIELEFDAQSLKEVELLGQCDLMFHLPARSFVLLTPLESMGCYTGLKSSADDDDELFEVKK